MLKVFFCDSKLPKYNVTFGGFPHGISFFFGILKNHSVLTSPRSVHKNSATARIRVSTLRLTISKLVGGFSPFEKY